MSIILNTIEDLFAVLNIKSEAMKQFLFNLDYRIVYLYRLYILKEHDCDNCSYFGGCMCDHIDEDGNCLGWESAGWHPFSTWLYHHRIKKMAKKYKKSFAIRKH